MPYLDVISNMRNSIFILALLTSQLCFSQKGIVVLNDSAVLGNVSMIYQLSNISSFELANSELDELLSLTRSFIKQTNQELKSRSDEYGGWNNAKRYKIKNLGTYIVQIVPYLNEQGEKEVWINGFCNDIGPFWRNQLVLVLDGGNCYFNMRINLTKRTLLSAGTNGYA
jgi:hypothetical protein